MNRIALLPLVDARQGNTIATGQHAGAFQTDGNQSANRRGNAGLFVTGEPALQCKPLRVAIQLLSPPAHNF